MSSLREATVLTQNMQFLKVSRLKAFSRVDTTSIELQGSVAPCRRVWMAPGHGAFVPASGHFPVKSEDQVNKCLQPPLEVTCTLDLVRANLSAHVVA